MEDLSPGFEGYLSFGKYFRAGIERSRFEIMGNVYVLDLKHQKKFDSPKLLLFAKQKYNIMRKLNYFYQESMQTSF